jgi:hypothetical protein
LLWVASVTTSTSSAVLLLLSVVLHVLLRVVHVSRVVLLLLLLVVLELVGVNGLCGRSTPSSVVVVSAGNDPSAHGRGGWSSVGILFTPRALCNLSGDLGAVHGHDGAAGRFLVVESHEGVTLVAEKPEIKTKSNLRKKN